MKRLSTLRGYTAHARYLSTVSEDFCGYIARTAVPSPYAYAPTHTLSRDDQGREVFIVETAHRKFEIFAITDEKIYETDGEATDAFIRGTESIS